MDRLDWFLRITQFVLAFAGIAMVVQKARRENRSLTGGDKAIVVVFVLYVLFTLWITLDPQ